MNEQIYVVVTDFIKANSGEDVSDAIQKIIDDHPNRTIFFPDGEYLLSKPILTPANPKTSVSLRLAEYACLRAAKDYTSEEAMVRLGAKDPANDIYTMGSNYALEGGEIDGSGIASGVSIDGGRETAIRNVSVKHTKIGLHIKHGANSGSSDSDIFGVNITGNGSPDSIGLLVEGYDNTFTNMRIAAVHIGVSLKSSGNSMRNLHPLYTCNFDEFDGSIGFLDRGGNNWYSFCYSDQFQTGFRLAPHIIGTFDSCFCFWYTGRGGAETAVYAEGQFHAGFTNLTAGFRENVDGNAILRVEEDGGDGEFSGRVTMNPDLTTDETFKSYLTGKVIRW